MCGSTAQWFAPIDDIVAMYHPYHEMDISRFCDEMDRLYRLKYPERNLQRIRRSINLSQRELSERSGVSIRTIQELEQGRKDINRAGRTSGDSPLDSLVFRSFMGFTEYYGGCTHSNRLGLLNDKMSICSPIY